MHLLFGLQTSCLPVPTSLSFHWYIHCPTSQSGLSGFIQDIEHALLLRCTLVLSTLVPAAFSSACCACSAPLVLNQTTVLTMQQLPLTFSLQHPRSKYRSCATSSRHEISNADFCPWSCFHFSFPNLITLLIKKVLVSLHWSKIYFQVTSRGEWHRQSLCKSVSLF